MTNFILFIILFGILVFIHEFGHFIIARKVGVGVEKFFLGFGPKMFSVKRGETEYGINWIPLGGYVKLLGEDPAEQAEQKEGVPTDKYFMAKTPWQRIAVVGAGPVSNLILPVILFGALYFLGVPSLGSVIGEVVKGSPAESAGLKQGDKVTKALGREINKWDELTEVIRGSQGKKIDLSVVRQGKELDISVKPRPSVVENIFKEEVEGWTIGITPYQYEPAVCVSDRDKKGARSGFQNGDIVKKVGVRDIDYFWQIDEALKVRCAGDINVSIQRGEDKASQNRGIPLGCAALSGGLGGLGLESCSFYVGSVDPNGEASSKGVKRGDRLVTISGKEISSWLDIDKAVKENGSTPLKIELLREGKNISVALSPRKVIHKEKLMGAYEERFELGLEPLETPKEQMVVEYVEQTYNPFKAVFLGTVKSWEILKAQVVGFAKLLSGKLSFKHIGGPIMIYKFAGGSFQAGGLLSFISAIALLSIVLGFVNLLPIPILDGGHIFFNIVELIKRGPVSLKTREIAQQVGFVIIIALVILASYNDINRYFWNGIVEFFKKIF